MYWLIGNDHGPDPSCWSIILKPVADNINTHSRGTLLIINVDVWYLIGLISGNSGVYGPGFAWGWKSAGIEDNKTISIFDTVNWNDILPIHKWTIEPILWKIQYGWMVILQFGITDIYDLLTISDFLTSRARLACPSSNAIILFVNNGSIVISTELAEIINKIWFELVKPLILKPGFAELEGIKLAPCFGVVNDDPELESC